MPAALPGERGIGQNHELRQNSQARERPGATEELLRGDEAEPERAGLVPGRPGRGRGGHAEHHSDPAAGTEEGEGHRPGASEREQHSEDGQRSAEW